MEHNIFSQDLNHYDKKSDLRNKKMVLKFCIFMYNLFIILRLVHVIKYFYFSSIPLEKIFINDIVTRPRIDTI